MVVRPEDTQQRPSCITLVPRLRCVAPEAKNTSLPAFRRGFGCVGDRETPPTPSTPSESNPCGTPSAPPPTYSSVPSSAPPPSTANHITTRTNKDFTWRPPSDSPPASTQPHQTEQLTKVRDTQETEEHCVERPGHTPTLQLLHAPAEEQNYLPKKLRACKKFQGRRDDAACIQWQHQHHHRQ